MGLAPWTMTAVAAALGFVASVPPAGPGSALVIRWATAGRRGAALAAGVGCAAGEGLYALVGISGAGLFVERHPGLLPPLAVAGVTALVLFAFRCLVALPAGPRQLRPPPRQAAQPAVVPRAHAGRSLLAGHLTALVNPLPLLSWSATFAAVVALRGTLDSAADRLAFAAGVVLGVAAWLGALGLVVARLSARLGPRFDRALLRATGVLLLLAAVAAVVRVTQR